MTVKRCETTTDRCKYATIKTHKQVFQSGGLAPMWDGWWSVKRSDCRLFRVLRWQLLLRVQFRIFKVYLALVKH